LTSLPGTTKLDTSIKMAIIPKIQEYLVFIIPPNFVKPLESLPFFGDLQRVSTFASGFNRNPSKGNFSLLAGFYSPPAGLLPWTRIKSPGFMTLRSGAGTTFTLAGRF
jgi:hypothetical protein